MRHFPLSVCGMSGLLFVVTVLSSTLSKSASGGEQERCVYHHLLNLSQSRDIVCSSRFMQESHYYHFVGHRTVAEKPMDIIHCEASTDTLIHLNLYPDANEDGLKLLVVSSVPCVFINSTNCACVDLYLNLSHFDQHNDSTIPVCGFTQRDHNLDCFCIHYILVNTSTDHRKTLTTIQTSPEHVTTQTTPEHVTTGKTEHSKAQSQPAVAPQGISTATFSSVVSMLVIAIVTLSVLLLLAILYIVQSKKKQSRRSQDLNASTVTSENIFSSSSAATLPKNDTPKDISRVVIDEAGSDDEHHDDIEETDALLQSPVIQRSMSCPYPVGISHEGPGGDSNNIMLM